jgi:hypothetical protein
MLTFPAVYAPEYARPAASQPVGLWHPEDNGAAVHIRPQPDSGKQPWQEQAPVPPNLEANRLLYCKAGRPPDRDWAPALRPRESADWIRGTVDYQD